MLICINCSGTVLQGTMVFAPNTRGSIEMEDSQS